MSAFPNERRFTHFDGMFEHTPSDSTVIVDSVENSQTEDSQIQANVTHLVTRCVTHTTSPLFEYEKIEERHFKAAFDLFHFLVISGDRNAPSCTIRWYGAEVIFIIFSVAAVVAATATDCHHTHYTALCAVHMAQRSRIIYSKVNLLDTIVKYGALSFVAMPCHAKPKPSEAIFI